MDKLPPEILHTIFIQLDLQQRLKCLLVCRSWQEVLNKYCLFHNVTLSDDSSRFRKMMSKFKRFPDRAAQVQELDLHIKCNTRFNRREIFNIFPNARVLTVNPHGGSRGKVESHFKEDIRIRHATSKLEYLYDIRHCEVVSQMIYSNLGGHLKTLSLYFHEATIHSQLKNLPVLNKLIINASIITIHDIETIHTNIPSLQELRLDNVKIEASTMPSYIIPATIAKLKFQPGRFQDVTTHIQCYQYLTQKYANITTFEYSDRSLKQYNPSDRKNIYLNGVLDLFKVIDWSQNTMSLYSLPDDVDVFDALDTVDAYVKDLVFDSCNSQTSLQNLARSNQFKYIEKLSFWCTDISSIHLIKDMPALNTLKISSLYPETIPLDLASCLNACPPSLKNLAIGCGKYVVKPLSKKLDSIETLDINFGTLTSGVGDVISSCFPNLLRLNLRGNLAEDLTIALDSPHFQKAIIRTKGVRNGQYLIHGFTFSWPNRTEPPYYLCKVSHFFERRKLERVPYEQVQRLPMLLVTSLTKKKVQLKEGIEVVQR